MGMAHPGLLREPRAPDDPFIESHLDIRDAEGNVVPGYGWIFPLGDGRINVGVGLLSTDRRWKGVNTTKLMETFVDFAPEHWGISAEQGARARHRRPAPDGPLGRVRARATTSSSSATPRARSTPSTARASPMATRPAAWPPPPSARRCSAAVTRRWPSYDERLAQAYGPYYDVARAFVRLISEPRLMALCVGRRHALRAR